MCAYVVERGLRGNQEILTYLWTVSENWYKISIDKLITKGVNPVAAYRIAICDDNNKDAEFLQNILNTWATERQAVLRVEVFSSAEAFLFRYAEDKEWDILLLDIEMGAMDGVTMAKEIRRENETVQIVFVTGFPDFVTEGYEVSALHYLMKPASKEKLRSVLDRAVRAVEGLRGAEPVILLPVEGETIRLQVAKVQYVEAFSHSIVVYTAERTYQVKMQISEMEKNLGAGFVRCHRSYLVGVRHIARLSKKEVVLDDGKGLPLSRSAATLVHNSFVGYYTDR